MSKPRDDRQVELFRPALEQIIDLTHPLVRLAAEIDWTFVERRFGAGYRTGPGQPPVPTRLIAGLLILKHMPQSVRRSVVRALGGEPVFPVLLR